MKRESMKKVAKSFPHGWDVGSSNERERMDVGAVRAVCNPGGQGLAQWNGESCMAAKRRFP